MLEVFVDARNSERYATFVLVSEEEVVAVGSNGDGVRESLCAKGEMYVASREAPREPLVDVSAIAGISVVVHRFQGWLIKQCGDLIRKAARNTLDDSLHTPCVYPLRRRHQGARASLSITLG